jgi:hypothetical protein
VHPGEQCSHHWRLCTGNLSDIHQQQMFSLLETFVPTGTLSFHSYSFHHTAESFFCESLCFTPSDHKNFITERCSCLVQLSGGLAMILALWFESWLSCHQLHTVGTCPIDVSTCCSSFIKLCPVLSNIQSICPYLLKSLCTCINLYREFFNYVRK